jgi:hypothetical protein
MEELRRSLFEDNPQRSTILVSRQNLLEDALHIYDNPETNVLARPMVTFVGEAGSLKTPRHYNCIKSLWAYTYISCTYLTLYFRRG